MGTFDPNTDESLIKVLHQQPLFAHPGASDSHGETYFYMGTGDPHGLYTYLPGDTDPSKVFVGDVDISNLAPKIHTSTSDPDVTDDITNFGVGQLWLNTSNHRVFVLTISTDGAAFWMNLGGTRINVFRPTSGQNEAAGYNRGSLWYSFTTGVVYTHVEDGVWYPVNAKYVTSDPTVTDDTNAGLYVGQVLINTTTGEVFTSIDATNGAAKWQQMSGPLYSIATFSSPPTLSQLQTAFPDNAAIANYQVMVNPGGAGTNFYLCTRNDGVWTYTTQTIAT